MILSEDIKKSINTSVLCWVATVSKENMPNVSPKEIFTYHKNSIIIANIASPQTIKNIKHNQNVCVSFIDVLVQKGYQLKGKATIVSKSDDEFDNLAVDLLNMTGDKFPFNEIIKIDIESTKPIIAPKYILYPETTEAEQIESAKKSYGLS